MEQRAEAQFKEEELCMMEVINLIIYLLVLRVELEDSCNRSICLFLVRRIRIRGVQCNRWDLFKIKGIALCL